MKSSSANLMGNRCFLLALLGVFVPVPITFDIVLAAALAANIYARWYAVMPVG